MMKIISLIGGGAKALKYFIFVSTFRLGASFRRLLWADTALILRQGPECECYSRCFFPASLVTMVYRLFLTHCHYCRHFSWQLLF